MPLTQSQPNGSIVGMPGAFGEEPGCLPPAHIGSERSTELRAGGTMSEPWPLDVGSMAKAVAVRRPHAVAPPITGEPRDRVFLRTVRPPQQPPAAARRRRTGRSG